MRRIPAALAVLALAVSAAWALEGHVHDPEGKPIEGAAVCYVLPGGLNGLCAATDERGYYELPDSRIAKMRVRADGYLLLNRDAMAHDGPLRLERAASIRVRLRDAASGQPIEEGRVRLVTPTGKRRGPFPVNAQGVRVNTLEPGRVKVLGVAEGYRDSDPRTAELVGGRETELVLDLEPRDDDEPRDG